MAKRVDMQRLDANRVKMITDTDLEIILFANEQVPIDRASVQEVATLAEISNTIRELNKRNFFGEFPADIYRGVLTPDFHKGAGVPVGTVLSTEGFVLPRCPGMDIGCGMRVIATNLTRDDFAHCTDLDNILRHAFFQGGRDIPMDEIGRAGMLRDGVIGLQPLDKGIWQHIDHQQMLDELAYTHRFGHWPTRDLWMFDDYVRGSGGISRDSAIGSIGGGNHFVELQYVEQCLDRQTAWRWGLRVGMLVIMVHTGSVGLGGMVGDHFVERSKQLHPTSLTMPEFGYHPLPTVGPLQEEGEKYLSAMGLACNFSIVNRLMLGMMTLQCLTKALGREVHGKLVYDAPHNLIWSEGHQHLHRKGATPAECDYNDRDFPDGYPVIVPGSMGDASYILKGHGNIASLCSAPHGAGRLVARGAARKSSPKELRSIRVVTKLDLKTVRSEIAAEYMKDLLEEAPDKYKPVLPVVETIRDAGIASPVVELRPLLTIKG